MSLAQKIGALLHANLVQVLPLHSGRQERVASIYLHKYLPNERAQAMGELAASFRVASRAFQYCFCDAETEFMDIAHFIDRFIYLKSLRDFYLVNVQRCTSRVQQATFEYLQALLRQQVQTNNILVLFYEVAKREEWVGAQFPPYSSSASMRQRLGSTPQASEMDPDILENTVIFTSEYAGLGKSHQIRRRIGDISMTRVPLHGTYSRAEIIELLRARVARRKDVYAVHLDVTDRPERAELDQLLFELLVLRYVRNNAAPAVYVQKRLIVCLEIANSMPFGITREQRTTTQLADELYCLRAFPQLVRLKFELHDTEVPQEENCRTQRCLRYLQALKIAARDDAYKLQLDFGLPYSETGTRLPLIEPHEGRKLLREYFFARVRKPSYYALQFFLRFFAKQMKGLDASPFFSLHLGEEREAGDIYRLA
jgi:hypothetical protein